MKINLEGIVGVVIAIAVIVTVYFNNSLPEKSGNGYTYVQPKNEQKIVRGSNDDKETDNTLTLTHVDSGDSIQFFVDGDNLLWPKNPDGTPTIPRKTEADGKIRDIWSIDYSKKAYFFDLGWDFGTYAGYLDGDKRGRETRTFDVGLRASPVRIYGTFAPDFLISSQAFGVGLSAYPAPERFGRYWNNLGVGYGRVYTFDNHKQANLYYISISTRF